MRTIAINKNRNKKQIIFIIDDKKTFMRWIRTFFLLEIVFTIICKSDLAVKRPTIPKKVNPCKKNQLIHATKRARKVMKTSKNVRFKSSKSTQKKRNLQAKFEELDIDRQNAAMTQPGRNAATRERRVRGGKKTFQVSYWPRKQPRSKPVGSTHSPTNNSHTQHIINEPTDRNDIWWWCQRSHFLHIVVFVQN